MRTFLLILLIGFAIAFIPLSFIWALNTLFLLHIPITFKTWLASLLISWIVYGGGNTK